MEQKEVVITRIINARKDQVWKTWTDPELIKWWWGPKTYSAPFITSDFRIGGKYHFAMRDPEGQLIWSTGVYKDIRYLEKIVATDSFADDKGNIVSPTKYGMPPEMATELEFTVTFQDEGSKTKLTINHKYFPPGEIFDQCKIGWNESLDKFEATIHDSGLDNLATSRPQL